MPARSRRALLVDTSVAVAVTVADHEHHEETIAAVAGRRLGLCGHAAFETFSVLTRLPTPARRSAATVTALLAQAFPETRFLSARAAAALLDTFASSTIAGGAVYDALIGACAAEHGLELVTRDRRALETYRALDVHELLLV